MLGIGWAEAVILLVMVGVAVTVIILIARAVSKRLALSREGARGLTEDYRDLVTKYETLASQAAALNTCVESELKQLRAKVDSMERLLSEVG